MLYQIIFCVYFRIYIGGISMTEILLLGTFHFRESSFDFGSDVVQDELERFTQKLSEFKPDVIAVEAAVHQQEVISRLYQGFNSADLRNSYKVRNDDLGNIHMFGETRPLTYNNETVQIGFKLGKMLDLDNIYAIDDDSELGNAEIIMPFLTDTIETIQEDMHKHKEDSIIELYRYYNSVEWSKLNHNIYIRANTIKIDGAYIGAEMVSEWYKRNLKIFSNIQQLAVKSKRLFVIYGPGHLQILKDLINADDNLKLVDTYEYL